MKLAVITYLDRGSYAVETVPDEDKILSTILKELAVDFEFEVWSDKTVNWRKYDLLLLKSPWDYFDFYEEFLEWSGYIQNLGIPVFNDLATVLWNADKSYLYTIQQGGFSIVSTEFIQKGDFAKLQAIIESAAPSDCFVIKPAVSGGSKNTIKFNTSEFKSIRTSLSKLLLEDNYLLQPFLPEIATKGEFSYIFFNGKFSHAVLKKATQGEFRVQHFYGGTIHSISPNEQELSIIQKYVDTFAANTLYARVDGTWRNGEFLLMELELIEPYLFLFTHPDGIKNYKNAIQERMNEMI